MNIDFMNDLIKALRGIDEDSEAGFNPNSGHRGGLHDDLSGHGHMQTSGLLGWCMELFGDDKLGWFRFEYRLACAAVVLGIHPNDLGRLAFPMGFCESNENNLDLADEIERWMKEGGAVKWPRK